MKNKFKLALLMLLPMWGTLINIGLYMFKDTTKKLEDKQKPLLIMTGVVLISYVVLVFGGNFIFETLLGKPNMIFISTILSGYIVNIIHYIHYVIKYINK